MCVCKSSRFRIFREVNRCADPLANAAHDMESKFMIHHQQPTFLSLLLQVDLLGVSSARFDPVCSFFLGLGSCISPPKKEINRFYFSLLKILVQHFVIFLNKRITNFSLKKIKRFTWKKRQTNMSLTRCDLLMNFNLRLIVCF